MLKLLLLLSSAIIFGAATGTLKLEFQATKTVGLQLSFPASKFNYSIDMDVSTNKKTAGYYSQPNETVLLVRLSSKATSKKEDFKILLKNNDMVSKTFCFDDAEISLKAEFTCDSNTDDLWCDEIPAVDVVETGTFIVEVGQNIKKISVIVLEFVNSFQGLLLIITATLLITCFIVVRLVRRQIRHTSGSYDIEPVELLQFKQRCEYAIMVSVV